MCDCIEKTEASLKEHPEWNTCLDIPFTWNSKGGVYAERVTISTTRADENRRPKNQKPVKIFATFCPFCGEKYPDKEQPSNANPQVIN